MLIAACMGIALTAMAQQHGIVRTLERPGKPSVGIEGASLDVLEYPNAIVSKKGGKFSFTLKGKRQGDSFTVTRVQKKGYTLVDKQLKGRRFAYSSLVPLEIVMVADQQLMNDKKRIEDKAYDKAKKNFDQKVADLEKQLKEKTISEQEYRAKYEELDANYNNYIKLIDQMAERYATTDYKGLNDINREILECIENADLERADSLINTKGSFDKREQELADKHELIMRTEELSRQLQDNYNAELQDLIQDYYNKHTIHAAAYRNDSAAYYLERIVQLSPDDVSMMLKTADFIGHYLADYQRTLNYYQMGYAKLQELNSDDKLQLGSFCDYIGGAYSELGDIAKSLEWHNRALEFYEQMDEPDSTRIAASYLGIGKTYFDCSNYDKVREYTLKCIQIYERAPEQNAKDLSIAYNNLGVLFYILNDYDQALEYQLKAVDLRERYMDNENNYDIADLYYNIASLYGHLGNTDKSLEYYHKALNICQRVLGSAHPRTINIQTGIANVYTSVGNVEKELEHNQEALKGAEKYYGIDDETTTDIVIMMARAHYLLGDKGMAQQEMQRATDAIERSDGAESVKMAKTFLTIGNCLKDIKDYDESLQYYTKAQSILQALGVENDYTTLAYVNPGTIYNALGQYDKALECYLRVLDIEQKMTGEKDRPFYAIIQKFVGEAYKQLGKKQLALDYLQQALDNFEQLTNRREYESYINETKAAITELKGGKH